jgi:sensor c-di-GMP phosphodiesterase-like protein
MIRRDRLLLGLSATGFGGVLLLFGAVAWYVWHESVTAEEARLGLLARKLGEDVERTIVEARDMLDGFNRLEVERCSGAHLEAMQEAAITKPYIQAVGYWQAADRLCGVGFVRGTELTPSRADRIYPSGVVAWWPSAQTELGGVQFFLMRYGAHDVAIDPRLLLDTGIVENRKAALWVEGLWMAAHSWEAELPSPESVAPGLTVDAENNRVISRFSLGTIFPIDVVAVEPIASFRNRYLPMIVTAAALGILLIALWVYLVYRYSRRQLSLDAELREAIAAGRLLVHYQPIVELAGGRCVGAEALVRWRREGGNLVRPDVFIPVAEQAGLVPQVTRAVLCAVLDDLGKLLSENPDMRINLNLSREDLESSNLLQILHDELAAARIPASSIKLEITERALINSDVGRRLIHDLRQHGHHVAIDDFGTGYSSLSYLETFEVDTLKIDKSFVDAIETEAVTSNVITHVIEMAHSLKLDTVAEGIEYPHQAEWLREQGVVHGQGYLYSKPLTARRFIRYYRRNIHQDE